jgi:ATP-dependent DNA ligase
MHVIQNFSIHHTTGPREGVVSKRRDAPYRSGDCRDWRKVKTAAWREVNRGRWRLFEQAK